jgi:ABC-type lipoprotein export system ATPase subunit
MTAPDDASAVDIRDLYCLYRGPTGDVAALRGLSLTVEAGERVLVQGPNGAGKTTLLRVLQGETPASAGVVRVGGSSVPAWSRGRRQGRPTQRVGYVEQSASRVLRPELTVVDNVALQLRLSGVTARAARRRAGDVLDRLGLGSLGGRRPGTLSGGEAQRVGVAAAVAHAPSLLLADEPTGALDRTNAEEVYDLLSDAARSAGAALLLVSHDGGAGRVVDRVVRIRDGRVSEQWAPGEPAETLVVDERGWVRLPEDLRRAAGAVTGAEATYDGGSIRLAGTSVAVPPEARRSPAPRPDGAGALAARATGVSVARGGRTVLAEVDLVVRKGWLTVVSGRSGAGKSTLLRLLAGLDRPDSGRVEVVTASGLVDLGRLDRNGLADLRRTQVAYSGQSVYLPEMLTVAETLALTRVDRGLGDDESRSDAALVACDLDALRDRQVRLLSGGERQRVAVARAVSVGLGLVLLDEPTAQLDEAHAELVAAALVVAASEGAAIVVASHDPVLVAVADQVLELR